jgi:hypothetical protein
VNAPAPFETDLCTHGISAESLKRGRCYLHAGAHDSDGVVIDLTTARALRAWLSAHIASCEAGALDRSSSPQIPRAARPPRWLPVDQAAAALGITARTLRYRAQHGRIERRRDGTAVLYLTPAPQPPGAP